MRHSGKVRKNGRKGVKRKTTDLSLDVHTVQLSVRTSGLRLLVQKVAEFTDGTAEFLSHMRRLVIYLKQSQDVFF